MNDTVEATLSDVELATKDWVSRADIDTERRIEKAFHEQTRFLTEKLSSIEDKLNSKIDSQNIKFDSQNIKIDSQTRWMVGLMITMTVAILVAVLFK